MKPTWQRTQFNKYFCPKLIMQESDNSDISMKKLFFYAIALKHLGPLFTALPLL